MKKASKIFQGLVFSVALGFASVAALAAVIANSYSVTTTPVVVDTSTRNFPITVTIAPQSGVSGSAEFSTSPNAATAPASAIWQVLGTASAVTVAQTITVTSAITAVRFSRISGASAVIGEVNWPR
jgi:hypothetical protein